MTIQAFPPVRRHSRFFFSTGLICSTTIALALFGCSAGQSSSQANEASGKSAPTIAASPALHAAEGSSIADVVEGVLPSVVSITSTKNARPRSPMDMFFGHGQGQPQSGLGSGVIISSSGVIVTNNHVIEGADTVKVQTYDDREFEARVVGSDPKSDVAVLQLEGEVGQLMPARIGDSGALRLGDVVLAVGNPFGVGQTVTMGIVSATGRSDMGIVDYENFIQTDAAINPGNSGGALINMRGELVGINTAILSRSGGSMGIGFAIPTSMASPIIDALQTDGKVTRGWLGVRIQDLNADLREALSLGAQDGVLIADVQEGGPGSESGMKSGDVVVKVGAIDVHSTGQFRNLIASTRAESKVALTVIREGKKIQLKVKLGALPGEDAITQGEGSKGADAAVLDGLALKNLDDSLRRRLDVDDDVKGVVIVRVTPGSLAARAKLRPGDVLLEVNRHPVTSVGEVEKEYKSVKGPKLLKILRQGVHQYVVLK